jgi:hypothetical protein
MAVARRKGVDVTPAPTRGRGCHTGALGRAAPFGPIAAFVIIALVAVYDIVERAPGAPAASGDGAEHEVRPGK